MAPVASLGRERRWSANASGLRKAAIRPICGSSSTDLKFGIEAVDRLDQHRVAEAVDGVRELGDDRRVDGGVVAVRGQERVDLRLDRARELLEHEMLVLHLGAELGGLEQALAVPLAGVDRLQVDRERSATSAAAATR